jgi:Tfp pilus assembly pilus retraction ATPase PilT
MANLIRTGKIEQVYSVLQTKTRDVPEERMTTLEKSLAELAHRGIVSPMDAERYANHPGEFTSQLRYLGPPGGAGSPER